jgi:hypothetical protein
LEFYVYQLIDPRDGKPFYIGKGKEDRLDAHEAEAKKNVQSHKCNVIRKIWAQGLEVQKEIVRRFRNEDAAYRFEARLIKRIGLENLTNLNEGGRNPKNFKPDPEMEKDKESLWLFAFFGKRSNGFKEDLWLFGGERHHLGQETVEALHNKLRAIAERRGRDWVCDYMLRKHNVRLVESRAN